MKNITLDQIKKAFRHIKTKGHKCNCCGHIHREIPKTAAITHGLMAGIWWDCDCKSTMFKKLGGK